MRVPSGDWSWRRALGATLWVVCVLGLLAPGAARADDAVTDWRGALTCPASDQVHAGLLYCTGADRAGATVHVVVADLSTKDLHFEYVLPQGASDRNAETQRCGASAVIEECRDPNIPGWAGPEKGCFVPCDPEHYPRLTLAEAVARGRVLRKSPALAAMINGDYMSSDATHGPEGLLVVRGERLDGAANCDDDYNTALRPWVGLGDKIDKTSGLIPATISRLERDSSPLPDWLYTGLGGGPWLVYKGQLDEVAAACDLGSQLDQVDAVRRCTGYKKSTPAPPLWEKYGAGSCRSGPQSAAGLSQDGRWLFLAVSAGDSRPDVLAQFLRGRLGAWNVMKLDGGTSSQMWFAGASEVKVDPSRSERPLSSYLAVYAPAGDGIALQISAEPLETVYYKVILPGKTADVEIEVRNIGPYSWAPEDGIELRSATFFGLARAGESLPLSETVPPGGVATWNYRADRTSYLKFQVGRKGQASGAELAVAVVALPQGLEDKRQELEQGAQQAIADWKAQGEARLEDLVQTLRAQAEEALKNAAERTLETWNQKAVDWLRSTCGSPAAWGLVGMAMVLAGRRRRK